MKDGTSVMTLGWTGPLGQELKDEHDEGEALYSSRRRARSSGSTPGSCSPTRRIPNAAYAWLNFIHEPEIQGEETNYNLYATPNDAAKEFVDPKILADTAVFPPDDVIANLEGAEDTSGNTQRDRHLGGVQAGGRRLTRRPGG